MIDADALPQAVVVRTIPVKPPIYADAVECRVLAPLHLTAYEAAVTIRQRQVLAFGEALKYVARVRVRATELWLRWRPSFDLGL